MSQNPGVGQSFAGTISTKTPLTALTPAKATVTGSSSSVVSSNSLRKGLIIINLSMDVISLAFGSNNAVANYGITLTEYGSTYQMSEYDFSTSAINAISSGTSSLISIQEFQ